MKLGENSAISSEGPECPHCGAVTTPDEGWWYSETDCSGPIECGACEKQFSVSVHASFHWTTRKCESAEAAAEAAS